jgi:hypothetical protein
MDYEDIQHNFKLPIFYSDNITKLENELINDLEFTCSHKTSHDIPCVYESLFNPTSDVSKALLPSWSTYISHDKSFIKSSQNIISSVELTQLNDIDAVHACWKSLKNNNGFLSNYQYIDWQYLEPLNKDCNFLQIMSIYNLLSPIISLVLPILFSIIPFFILKFQGIAITFSVYIEHFKLFITKLPIGKLFIMHSMNLETKIYSILSVLFYVFQLYQNILSCCKFYINQLDIKRITTTIAKFINHTIVQGNKYLVVSTIHQSYSKFNIELKENIEKLSQLHNTLNNVTTIRCGMKELCNIGYNMQQFYELYKNDDIKNLMAYSFGLNAYFDNISNVKLLTKEHTVSQCKFTTSNTSFKKAYHHTIPTSIKNTYSTKYNALITGPNASGKTSILKTSIINIILSQQLGFGFYKSAKINPYKYIHCYLNIPDTSGRDSLFQAEARRCKHIIDTIISDPLNRHFCVFDELYSGTNPLEATASAHSYLEYLSSYKSVDFMITTHYIELCKVYKHPRIKPFHMDTIVSDKGFIYTYKLTPGISSIKGGIKILKDLDYPEQILCNTQNYLRL